MFSLILQNSTACHVFSSNKTTAHLTMCSYQLLDMAGKWLAVGQNILAPFSEYGLTGKRGLLSWNYISSSPSTQVRPHDQFSSKQWEWNWMGLTSEARTFKTQGFSTLTFPFATWKQKTLRFQGVRESQDGNLNPWMTTWRKAFCFPHLDEGIWKPGSLSHHMEENLLLSLCSLVRGQEINFSRVKPLGLVFKCCNS